MDPLDLMGSSMDIGRCISVLVDVYHHISRLGAISFELKTSNDRVYYLYWMITPRLLVPNIYEKVLYQEGAVLLYLSIKNRAKLV